jgi:hypothetical protein
MATVSVGNWGKALWPGINKWYGDEYGEWKVEYTDLFDTYKSDKHYVEDVGKSGLGLFQQRAEGAPVLYDSTRQAFITRYQHVEFALGMIITKVAYEDDQYGVIAPAKAKGLARGARQTKEILGANVYNRAFNTSYKGGDGSALCVIDHANFAGGTWSNTPSVASDLSEASLEQAYIDISKYTDDRGNRIAVMPDTIIIPVDLMFETERVLKTEGRVGTSDNDLNAIKSMGKFPGGVKISHYLTDTDAWFIRTDAPDGMKYFSRVDDTFSDDNDFDTDNAKYKARFRCAFGWTDPKGLYASPGA